MLKRGRKNDTTTKQSASRALVPEAPHGILPGEDLILKSGKVGLRRYRSGVDIWSGRSASARPAAQSEHSEI